MNVAAVFELKSVKTGMTIWKYESRATDRDYGVTKSGLELGTAKIFEDVVHEAVKKAMENSARWTREFSKDEQWLAWPDLTRDQ